MRTAIIFVMYFIFTVLFAVSAAALSTPKATPSISGSFCVNNITGAMRNVLVKNGIPQACHKNEQLVAVINFDSAPTATATPIASPSPGEPTPAPSPSPIACQGCVVDANGTEVGPLYPVGADAQQQTEVLVSINGVPMALPVGEKGFVSGADTDVQFTRWFPTADCTGQSYMLVGGDGNGGVDVQPLVEVASVQRGPYIFEGVVWYANPQWSQVTMQSVQACSDPTECDASPCANAGNTAPNLGTWLAGTPATFTLSQLGFAAPFTVNP